jgi:hypothetical protein
MFRWKLFTLSNVYTLFHAKSITLMRNMEVMKIPVLHIRKYWSNAAEIWYFRVKHESSWGNFTFPNHSYERLFYGAQIDLRILKPAHREESKRVVGFLLLFLILLFKLNRFHSSLNLLFLIWHFNLLKYNGAVYTTCSNVKKQCICSQQCIYVCRMILRTNSYFSPKQR